MPLRILNMKGVDLNTFRFDYDLTFAVLMTDAEGAVYSRFGTRDGGPAAARMSLAGLKNAMHEVLLLHRDREGRPSPPLSLRKPSTLEDIPAFKKSKAAGGECYHCHFAADFHFRQLRAEGKFRKEMLFQYPLPEAIGLTLDVDSNHLVKAVLPGSPAERAGLKPGDVILEAEGTRVLTSADLQFALQGVSDPGRVSLRAERQGQRLEPLALDLPRGWRKADIGWRASPESVPPTIGIWCEPLNEDQRRRRGIAEDRLALRVSFLFPDEGWAKTRGGLRMNDVLLGWKGSRLGPLNTREFHSRFRLGFEVGDTVVLEVLRGNETLEVPVPCLEVGGD